MPPTESLYTLAQRAARVAAPIFVPGDSKLGRGLAGRRGVCERLETWAGAHRDPERPLAWFHAPSVGEGLQARAVLEALRPLRPELQVAYTHFSPSALDLARGMPADVSDYLPWDIAADMGRALDALRPDLVVFTKTEVWPVLSRLCRERDVSTALVAATLGAGSSRMRPWSRRLLAPSYRRLAAVLAVGDADAARLRRLGASEHALRVTGDPGVDSAASRALAADAGAAWLAPLLAEPAPTIVAGSTWPADEAVLVPALTRLRDSIAGLRLVVAPHEPDERHVPPLLRALSDAGWRGATLGQVEAQGALAGADAVVVDRVGVLAHLYTVGSIAYVGGGFGRAGLHSVLEPAAAGLPVLFGPHHGNAPAAGDLLALGGARVVEDSASLATAASAWLQRESGASAARAARGYIEAHLGAAERSARALVPFLPDPQTPDR